MTDLNATSEKEISGGERSPASANLNRNSGSWYGISSNPSASIFSKIFSRDLACRTKFAYVPHDAMNCLISAISTCCFLYSLIWLVSCSVRVLMYAS